MGYDFSKPGLDKYAVQSRSWQPTVQEILAGEDAQGSFTVETLDAPLVSPGQKGLLVFDNQQPDMLEGIHVNLFNNLWGTTFPQWYGDDTRFRFVIKA